MPAGQALCGAAQFAAVHPASAQLADIGAASAGAAARPPHRTRA
ncbi:hypothetical protein [Streptomyces sp. NPDC060002]